MLQNIYLRSSIAVVQHVSRKPLLLNVCGRRETQPVMGISSSSPPMNRELDFVQEKLKSNCVVVFSKSTCPYCHMAKNVFKDIGMPYEAVEINTMPEQGKIQQVLGELTGATTVPRVFISGKCIGGGSETKALHKAGKLIPMLEESCGNIQANL